MPKASSWDPSSTRISYTTEIIFCVRRKVYHESTDSSRLGKSKRVQQIKVTDCIYS